VVEEKDIQVRHDAERGQYVIDFTVHNIGDTDAKDAVIQITVGFDDGSPKQSITLDIWSIPAGGQRSAHRVRVTDRATWFEVAADPDEVIDEETFKNNRARIPLKANQ